MAITNEDIKAIIGLVGREGTVSALEKSNKVNARDLLDLAHSLGLKPKSRDSKKTVASQLVQKVDMRITKPLDELKTMSKEKIEQYFEEVECHQDELIDLLKNIDLSAQAKSRRAMIEFAAIQINSLGIFERLSNHDQKRKTRNTLDSPDDETGIDKANHSTDSVDEC